MFESQLEYNFIELQPPPNDYLRGVYRSKQPNIVDNVQMNVAPPPAISNI
jgi:hypothetical protein